MTKFFATLATCGVMFMSSGPSMAGDFALNGVAANGAKLYKKSCATCHGKKGNGKGPAAIALTPRPSDFTNAAVMAKTSPEGIYKTIRDGGAAMGKSPLMTPWKAVLTDQQIRDITAVVLGFSGMSKGTDK